MIVQAILSERGNTASQTVGRPPGMGVDLAPISSGANHPPDDEDLVRLEEVSSSVERNLNLMHNVNLQFAVQGESGQVMVIVSDETTGEVIREIPPHEVLDLASRLEEMIGLLFDERG